MLPLTSIHTKRSSNQQHVDVSRAQRLARALGASFIYNLYYRIRHKGQSVEEPKKIAIRKDCRMALLAGLIHFIPVGAAFALIILNWRGYYIGSELAGARDEDDAKLFGLQLAAKIHELTITASLTTVVFSFIRHQVVRKSGLPFGAIVSGLQFKEISYLWSMEFWGAVRARWRTRRNKTALILLIVTCTGLAVSAGPASATLMRPRLDSWPAGGTEFWINSSPQKIDSTNVSASNVPESCMTDTGDLSCPSGGWQTLAQAYLFSYQAIRPLGYLPDTVEVPGAKAIRALRIMQRCSDFSFSSPNTVATIGSSSIADALVETGRLWAFAASAYRNNLNERFWSRKDATYVVEAQQPLVHVRCMHFDASDFAAGLRINTSASVLSVYDLSNRDHDGVHRGFEGIPYNYAEDEQVRSLVQSTFDDDTASQLAWSMIPQSNGSTLGATLTIPQEGSHASLLYQCTIAARMAPGKLTATRKKPSIVTAADHSSKYDPINTFPHISIDPAWAVFLNPRIAPDNSTAFQHMMKVAGLSKNSFSILFQKGSPDLLACSIESALSLLVVNGLARRDFGNNFSGSLLGDTSGKALIDYKDLPPTDDTVGSLSCQEWCGQILPSGGWTMGYGNNAFNISKSQKAGSTKFTMKVEAQGYAYNSRGSAVKFAIFAMLLYSAIALSQWMYTVCWSKETSSSWDSVSELVALAMRSDCSEHFVNTGAGIDNSAIFKQPTRIIHRDGRLQLAVGRRKRRYASIKPNTCYE